MKFKTILISLAFALFLFGSIVNQTYSGINVWTKAETHWFSAEAAVYCSASNVDDMSIGMYTGHGDARVKVGDKSKVSSGSIWVQVYVDPEGQKQYLVQNIFVSLSGWPWQSKTASASGQI